MIKPGALVMGAVMAAVAAGTYFGLDLLPPGTIPPPIGRIPPPPPHTVGEHTLVASTEATPSAAPAAAAPAPATDRSAAPTEQELSEEPAPAAPAPAPAQEVAQASPEPKAEPAPEPKAEPAPEPEPAPAPAEKPKARPAPKPAEPVAADQAATREPAEAPAPVTPSTTTADSDAMKQWWPEPSKLPANQLKLMYAGDVQGEAAIALLFGSVPNMDSLRTHAHVRNVVGADMPGTWETGKNPQLVVFRGLATGRYTVILDKELADTKGFALGQTLQGAVYIRAK